MSDRSERKLQEGLQHLQEAEKHLKTGFFKWRPDLDSASVSFQDAALAFKLAKEYEKACNTYERLADTQYKMGARFHTAKAYEECGNACKEMKNFSKALSYYDRASEMYMENGTPDTAVLCLERAGKVVELINSEWSISLYMKAADICQSEDDSRYRQAAELVDKAARLQVQSNKLSDAVNTLEHECQLLSQTDGGGESIPRLTCSVVLVHLHIGDPVRAEQSIYAARDYAECFEGSDEQDALMRLVEGFNEGEQDKIDIVLNTPMFKYMDNTYAKLARSLRVPGYTSDSPKHQPPKVTNLSPLNLQKQAAQVTSKIDNHMSAVNQMAEKMNSLTTDPVAGGGVTPKVGGASSMAAPVNQPLADDEDDDLC